MKTHILKTDPDPFMGVISGIKTFELRKNDRDFKVGDTVLLVETGYSYEEMLKGAPLIFTKRTHSFVIPYILEGPAYGLEEGWVILSI